MVASLLTNSAAISALSGLRGIARDMATVEGQVTSGYRVATAGDNAAYWSIATTMRSDNKVLSTVGDALALSNAMVDVAYTGMKSSLELLDGIKTRIVAASEPGVDRQKIQKEIGALQSQLQTVAASSSFNGENWLSADATVGADMSVKLVSGFTRDADGTVSLQKTDVDLSKVALFNAKGGGVLETEVSIDESDYTTMDFAPTLKSLLETAPQAPTSGSVVDPFTVNLGDEITFNVRKGAHNHTVVIDRATVNAALGSANRGGISNASELQQVMNKALSNAGLSSADVSTSVTNVLHVGSLFAVNGLGAGTSVSGVTITEAVPPSKRRDAVHHATTGIMEMDVTRSDADLGDYLGQMEIMLKNVTDAAADLGALQSRLSQQTSFTDDLMKTLDKGIGTLVDADMNEASTRLKALQTQQQLGIQALSIANSDSNNILQLFR